MRYVCYILGGAIFLVGSVLIYPIGTSALHARDPLLVLGAPIAMNGITLCITGFVLAFFGRVLLFLDRLARNSERLIVVIERSSAKLAPLNWNSATEPMEGKVVIKCPKCEKDLRVVAGKTGTIVCPNCEGRFEART